MVRIAHGGNVCLLLSLMLVMEMADNGVLILVAVVGTLAVLRAMYVVRTELDV